MLSYFSQTIDHFIIPINVVAQFCSQTTIPLVMLDPWLMRRSVFTLHSIAINEKLQIKV